MSDSSLPKNHLNKINAFKHYKSVNNLGNGEEDTIKVLSSKPGKIAKGSVFRKGSTDEKEKFDFSLGGIGMQPNYNVHSVSIQDLEEYYSTQVDGRHS